MSAFRDRPIPSAVRDERTPVWVCESVLLHRLAQDAYVAPNRAAGLPTVDLIRLVRHVARRYFIPGMEHEDVVQVGMLGALGALADWQANRGMKLTTWVCRHAEYAILQEVRSLRSQARTPSTPPLRLDKGIKDWPGSATYGEVLPDPRPGPEEEAERKQTILKVLERAKGLTDADLGVFDLLISGQSIAETALEFGVDRATVALAYEDVIAQLCGERVGANWS